MDFPLAQSDIDILVSWRQHFALSQLEASELLGVTRATINRYETGKSAIPKVILLLIEVWPNEPRISKHIAKVFLSETIEKPETSTPDRNLSEDELKTKWDSALVQHKPASKQASVADIPDFIRKP